MSKSPCDSCTRAKDPVNCQQKSCKAWHAWFMARWQEIHNYYLMVKEKFNCQHCDAQGFCRRYSNASVVWKCTEDADCEGYMEGDADD